MHLVLFCGAILQLMLTLWLIFSFDPSGSVRRARFEHTPQGWVDHGWTYAFGAEGVMRGIAATVGLLLYIGGRAAGISIPQLAFDALSNSFPTSFAAVGVVAPSCMGFAVSWFFIRHISSKDARKDAVAMRVLTLMMSLVFFLYCDSYIYVFSSGVGGAVHYLPNLVFVLSALLYAVLKYHPSRESA
jgi:F0F1-type ATP synthase assembly protein I